MKTRILSLAIALALAIASSTAFASAFDDGGKKINVIFRYDDYSTRSNTAAEKSIIETFRKHGMPVNFGVIPFPSEGRFVDPHPQKLLKLTEEKAQILIEALEAGVVEVALHGYSHQSVSDKYEDGLSEFTGTDFQVQLDRIEEGKAYLEGIIGRKIDVFIPPYEAYDANTLKALEQAGFRCLSAGRYGLESDSPGLTLIPSTCLIPWLEATIDAATQTSEKEALIVVLLHDTDFVEVDARRGWISQPDFDKLVGRLAARDDVAVITLGQALEMIGGLGKERFLAYKRFNQAFSLLPDFIRPLETGIFLSTEKSDSLVTTGWVFTVAYFALVVLVVAVVAFFAGKLVFRHRLWAAVLFYATLLGSAAGIAVMLRFFMRNYKGPLVVAFLAAVCIGAWLAYRSFRKKSKAESGA